MEDQFMQDLLLKDAGKVAMDYKVNIMQEWLLMSHKTQMKMEEII